MAVENAIKVTYIYSACIITETPDLKVLHDPWFTEGVYDGSWFHFPKVDDPLALIGDVDAIYISHIHPDHYDPEFLKAYFARYGEKEILIADHNPNHLVGKMRGDGLSATIVKDHWRKGDTEIQIIPQDTGSDSNIDSAIVLKWQGEHRTHCVVNANDVIFNARMRDRLKAAAGNIDILLCGYTGAGPFPQTYFDVEDPGLVPAAEAKKERFFDRYRTLTNYMQATVNIPFAGKYLLGGALTPLNAYRGVADPVEVLAFDSKAVVLADQGGSIDTEHFKPSAQRTEAYDSDAINQRIGEIRNAEMDYERLMSADEIHQLPLKRLLFMANRNAHARSECTTDYYFCIHLPSNEYAVVNANQSAQPRVSYCADKAQLPEPRSELYVDPRYLFGLLTHIYHWNNAEVGSQYQTRRVPEAHNRRAQKYLNFFTL